MRRTRAGSRMPCRRTRAPSSILGRLQIAVARLVLRGEHGGLELLAQFALGLGHAALGLLRELALLRALHDLADGLLRLLIEFGQHLLGAALQLLQLGGLALFPFARQFFFARGQSACCREVRLQRLHVFQALVQLAEEAPEVALAVAQEPRARGS
jgi:hypothetical protein